MSEGVSGMLRKLDAVSCAGFVFLLPIIVAFYPCKWTDISNMLASC